MKKPLLRCTAETPLRPEEIDALDGLDAATFHADDVAYCELQHRHTGQHMALGQDCRTASWWVRWTRSAAPAAGSSGQMQPPRLVSLPECPAENDADEWLCELPLGHPGGHSFDIEAPGSDRPMSPRLRAVLLHAHRDALKEKERRAIAQMEANMADGEPLLPFVSAGEAAVIAELLRRFAETDILCAALAAEAATRLDARMVVAPR
ncbi:hypothetical protein [Streptomyces sp. NPDC002221]|uniref:hypothetical protein n=1 Tax=Streptomyces sp. NPDC002221 TaxID=3364639 RepID=UPI00368FA096